MNLASKLNIKTTYSTAALIAYLRANKEAHIKQYKEAVEAFNKTKAEKLAKLLAATKAESEIPSTGMEALNNAYDELHGLVKPVDASKMYDEYISVLENATATDIELSMEDANAVINDSWTWANAARFSNSTYLRG